MKIGTASLKSLAAFLLFGAIALAAAFSVSGCRNYGPNYEKWFARERIAVPSAENGIRADFSNPAVRELAHFLPLVPETEKFANYRMRLEFVRIQSFNNEAYVRYGRRVSVFDTGSGKKLVGFEVWSDCSAEKIAARVRAELSALKRKAVNEAAQQRAISGAVRDVREQGKFLYVGSTDVFGWMFCTQMQARGWKCFSVKNFSEIPTDPAERESQFLLKFSGRRSRSDFAETVAGTLVDLRSGKELFSIRRDRISAEKFSGELTEIFNRNSEPKPPSKSSPKTSKKHYEK